MTKYLSIILVLIFFSSGCIDRDDNLSSANIRIKNNNSFMYDLVQVGNDTLLHENVGAGDYSEYFEYEDVYPSTFVQVDTAGTKYNFEPIDSLNTNPLSPGFYTYELELDAEGVIQLKLIQG